jgi:hypothetical protein
MLVGLFVWSLFFDWGFYAHKIINQHAVYSLPIEILPFYKNHIDYISKHAVDPDKRRYIVPGEGKKHFIDLDHWGSPPFPSLTKNYIKDLYTHLNPIYTSGDTDYEVKLMLSESEYDSLFYGSVLPSFLAEQDQFEWNGYIITIIDSFTIHGILPYHLEWMLEALTKAFKEMNSEKILRLSSEIGHYIGDATVPLHTTKNYNGQLTGQDGIHALWESRIPELLLEKEFNLWASKAQYIENPREFYWNLVLESHQLVEEVLAQEIRAKTTLKGKFHYCWTNRNQIMVKMECPEFVKLYHKLLGNQVESRLKMAIYSISSTWLTAWINAGKPSLKQLNIQSKKTPDLDLEIETLFLCNRPKE